MTKREMAEMLIRHPAWDGLKDAKVLAEISTADELKDALDQMAYLEFFEYEEWKDCDIVDWDEWNEAEIIDWEEKEEDNDATSY